MFDKQREIEFYFPAEKPRKVKIFTSKEIERYIEQNKKDIKKLYIKDKDNIRYEDYIENLGYYLKSLKLEIRQKDPLPEFKLKDALSREEDYSPNEYSKYFYEYFLYEDKKKGNEKLLFQKNKIREIIFDNIYEMINNKNIKTFKFTGPPSIGKSLTLLRLSRISYNVAYINLKTLNECKDNLLKSYSIVMSELERFDIEEKLQDFLKVVNESYNDNKSYLNLLLNIMKFLSEFQKKFVFIFDQFKLKYITDNFMEKIKEFDNINIVQCSSINDKNIRKECIKTWYEKGKNILKLLEDNQDFYFYFENIYNCYENNGCENNDIVFRQFDYMPKYINKYKHYNDKIEIYEEVKNKIRNKINEFCISNKLEKSLVYSNLRYIVNKEYNYEKFGDIIKYCPLKYFIIKFYEYNFKIKYLFPFIQNVINYEYTENDCDNYFKNELYKKDNITNNLIKGDYFEAAAKFGLMKLTLPENKNYFIKTLNEIASMDKIIDNKDNYYIEENDAKNKNNEEGKKETEDESNKSINELLNKKSKNEDNNIIKEENNEKQKLDNSKKEEEEESEKEEEEEEEEEEKELEGRELFVKKKIKIVDEKFENLLKEFSLDDIEMNSDKNKWKGLSKEAKLYSKTIEDYRLDEIKEQRKVKQEFDKGLINGDQSIFLDQYSKFGKIFDYAYIYGNRNEKAFIGFQMKCYFEDSTIKNKFVDKNFIKKSCRKILVNSMKLFNCKITKWYYYIVFYYNPNNKSENINKTNINKCKLNDISFFFYDPLKKKFYQKQKNKMVIMESLKADDIADLETNILDIDKYSYNLPNESKLNKLKEKDIMEKKFIEDLSQTFNMDINNANLFDILLEISKKLEIKDRRLEFHAKCSFNKSLICPKRDDCVLLYKKISNNNIDFIAGTKKQNKILYYEVSTGNLLNHIYNLLDEDADYYYCLVKTTKFKKRTHKEYIDENN